MKAYCSDEKLQEWKANKTSSEQRWVELFTHMEKNEVPYTDFSRVVEFAMCLPGANAITERVFSEVTNTWKAESTQIKIETLKSLLYVKLNLDYTCVEFHELLKANEDMLKQIASQEKYSFKQNKDNLDVPSTSGNLDVPSTSSSLDMSIDEN